MTASGHRWLDPKSDTYLGDFLADTAHYWDWYAGLEDLVRDGTHVELHEKAPDDPYWQSYIRGQYQVARLSSAEVAKAIPLAKGAHQLLDVAGAHGEYSMALCRRHEGLRATIVDLPGSARVGEEIVAESGDERPRPPPGRRHVRGRLRRPVRRRAQLQHHPSPLAGADPGALRPHPRGRCGRARHSASSTSTTGPAASGRTSPRSSASSSTSPPAPTPTPSRRSPAGWARAASEASR